MLLRPALLTLGIALAPALVQGECKATGIDYTDGGRYVIDASSTSNFTFATVFSGNKTALFM